VDQFLFTQVEGVHAKLRQAAEEVGPRYAGKLGGGPDDNCPNSYSLTDAARRIVDARASGVVFNARRISSGIENVTVLIGNPHSYSTL
jgi:hypothetical protein